MQQVAVVPFERFAKLIVPTFKLEDELIDCPEISVRNYHYLLHNNPEE
jgi:hypothetical protein